MGDDQVPAMHYARREQRHTKEGEGAVEEAEVICGTAGDDDGNSIIDRIPCYGVPLGLL